MKKAIVIIFATIMVLSLVSCGKPKETQLTSENYATYLTVKSNAYSAQPEGKSSMGLSYSKGLKIGSTTKTFFEEGIKLQINVKGASSNYDYNNVVITGNFKGTYGDFNPFNTNGDQLVNKEIDETLTVELNIAGDGSAQIILPADHYTCTELLDIKFEITEIKGTITKNQ